MKPSATIKRVIVQRHKAKIRAANPIYRFK